MGTNYNYKNKDIFEDAEPFHYGTGYPDAGYFLPSVGEDYNPNTSDDKIQNFLEEGSNGYSTGKQLSEFKIQGTPLYVIQKGTFPLMQLLGEYTNTSTSSKVCYLIVTYDGNSISSIRADIYTGSTRTDNIMNINNKNDSYTIHKHSEKFPSRIGFILTGGGGGCGGVSRIDPKSDGKNNDYTTPGGGGGGGEIVCGVLDISKPQGALINGNELVYKISLGGGGAGGKNGDGDPDYDDYDKGAGVSGSGVGTDGTDGGDSQICRCSSLVSGDSYNYYNYSIIPQDVYYVAKGGKGGQRGLRGAAGAGGAGGKSTQTLRKLNYGCTLCKSIPGGNGGSQVGESSTKNEALSLKLYFSNKEPPYSTDGEGKFYITKDHKAVETTHNANDMSLGASVAGGHSFGQGATQNNGAGGGGGGSCSPNYRNGCGAYIGFYY
jgi:hypothetical protein